MDIGDYFLFERLLRRGVARLETKDLLLLRGEENFTAIFLSGLTLWLAYFLKVDLRERGVDILFEVLPRNEVLLPADLRKPDLWLERFLRAVDLLLDELADLGADLACDREVFLLLLDFPAEVLFFADFLNSANFFFVRAFSAANLEACCFLTFATAVLTAAFNFLRALINSFCKRATCAFLAGARLFLVFPTDIVISPKV